MAENKPSSAPASADSLPIFQRLLGQETEYLIRFSRDRSPSLRRSNAALAEAMTEFIRTRVPIAPHFLPELGWFTANGGNFHLEAIPLLNLIDPRIGLIEGGTPECRDPKQLLRYQRAQDALLSQGIANAVYHLQPPDPGASASLLKSNRDAQGACFGCHENYEATLATGFRLQCWKVLLRVLTVAIIPLNILGLVLVLLASVVYAFATVVSRKLPASEHFLSMAVRVVQLLLAVGLLPLLAIPWVVVWCIAFRKQRRHLLAFLISRPIVCGAGGVEKKGRFILSPRALAIGSVVSLATEVARPVFYFGYVFKMPAMLFIGDRISYRNLFEARQRLQITCGDSNMSQHAEYLKFGTTSLILDAIENGYLERTPCVFFPLYSMRRICRDRHLKQTVWTSWGRKSALEIQSIYLDACRQMLDDCPHPHPEAQRVWQLWSETLNALERGDHDSLVGRVDWITKARLLREETDVDVRRKIDLRYHELSHEGYYLKLESAGGVPTLVEPEEVLAAVQSPPEGTPAEERGRLIRQHGEQIRVSWSSVRVEEGASSKLHPLT